MENDIPNPQPNRIQAYFANVFGIDVRSMAFFRIGIGVIVLLDLLNRASALQAHYTDSGLMPRWAMIQYSLSKWYYSLYFISGDTFFAALLFTLTALAAISFTIGFQTRTSGFITWLLIISLQNRNTMILDGGDSVLRIFLLWSLFLPLGARYSIDAFLQNNKSIYYKTFSLASFAYIYQLALLYFFAAHLKDHPIWIKHYSAVYYAFSLELFSTRLAHYLLQFPELLEWFTWGSLMLEYFGMLLLLVPFYNSFFRFICVTSFICFHIGLGLTLELGIFPPLMCVVWICLMPGFVWDILGKLKISKWIKSLFTLSFAPRVTKLLPKYMQTSKTKTLVELSTPARLFLTLCMVYITLWNIRSTDFAKYEKYFPRKHNWIGETLRIDQFWQLFAPYPTTSDGWYVIPAKLANGKEIDLWNNSDVVSYDKPDYVAGTYRNQRWRKYMINFWARKNSKYRPFFARYLCNNWNENHYGSETLVEFQIYYMLEKTLANYRTSKVKKSLVWTENCVGQTPVEN